MVSYLWCFRATRSCAELSEGKIKAANITAVNIFFISHPPLLPGLPGSSSEGPAISVDASGHSFFLASLWIPEAGFASGPTGLAGAVSARP